MSQLTPTSKTKLDWSAKVNWGFNGPAALGVTALFLWRNWPPPIEGLYFGIAVAAVLAIIFKLVAVWRAPRVT